MKEFFGQRTSSGRYVWQSESYRSRRAPARQESLRINFIVNSSKRDSALSLVANDLADHGEEWTIPLSSSDGLWRIDLHKLAAKFPDLADQSWLNGERLVMPDFDIIELPSEEKAPVVRLTILKNSEAMPAASIPSAQELIPFLDTFRREHPDPSGCGFLMMSFEETPQHQSITKCVRDVCSSLGLKALRANDHSYSDDLLPNIRTYMHGCGFGIAIFERLTRNDFNPNVALEVGYMFALGKPVCLLKDNNLQALQSDLVGRLYETFDVYRVEATLPQVLRRWLQEKRLARPRN